MGLEPVQLAANGGALLVHLTLKATVLLLVTFAVLGVLRRSSAALRHTLWSVCCLGLLVLPAFTIALPAWQPTLDFSGSAAVNAEPNAPLQLSPVRETTSVLMRTIAAGHSGSAPVISTEQWALAALFACWLLGLMVALRKLVLGFLVAKRLQHRGRLVEEGELWQEFTECAASLGLRSKGQMGAPRLVLVDDEALPIPLTWGWKRPVVLMPVASMGWSASCRHAAFLHELSHIRRLDWLIQSLASLACLFYWFHPLAWFAAQRLRLESERATDDHVLTTGLKATDYSSSLLEIVRFVGSHRGSGTHQKDSLMKFAVPIAGTSKIELRLRSLLDPKQKRSAVTRRLLAAVSLVAFAAIVPLAAAKEPAEGETPVQAEKPTLLIHNWKRGVSIVSPTGEEPILTIPVEMEDGRVVITPSKKTVVTGFMFSGNKTLTAKELQKVLVSKTGVLLDANNILADAVALHREYANKGIRLRVKQVVQNEAGVITYELQENPPLADSKSGGKPPIAGGEPDRPVISAPFTHRRGYANYVAGGQPPSHPTYVREAFVTSNIAGDAEQFSILRATSKPDASGQPKFPIVTGFKFTGNKALQADQLQKVLVSKTGVPLENHNVKADAAAIRKAYADKGLSVQVRGAALDESGVVSYDLLENLVVTGFKFSGNTVLTADDLQKVLVSQVGVGLNQESVKRDVTAIQNAFSAKGFAVLVKNASQNDDGVISYDLLEAKLTEIKLSGLTKTDPQAVRKLITTPVNAPFNASDLRRDMSRLLDTNFFESVTFKPDDDPAVQGGVFVTFIFEEKATNP